MTRLWTERQYGYLSSSDSGRRFLRMLPRRVAEAAGQCGVRVLGPAGLGATSIALDAVGDAGRRYVLKVDPDVERAAAAALAMAGWSQVGVSPRVYHSGTGWYLMERVEGTPVPRPLDDVARLGILVLKALTTAWRTPVPDGACIDRFGWVLPLTADRLSEVGHPDFPARMAEKAELLIPSLRAGRQLGTCHGDPVGGNLLVGSGRVLLIDPVPHEDPFEALVSHWAVRARDGVDTLDLARLMVDRSDIPVDDDALRAWAGIHSLTFTAYNLVTGRAAPADARVLTSVLR